MNSRAGRPYLATVNSFYSSILGEVERAGYSPRELLLLANTHLYYGRYLNPRLRNYFVQTVMPRIASAMAYLSVDRPGRCIMDLGCGLGMQSIIFASLGAKVVGVDVREEAIALCWKRKDYYERKLNQPLDVEFVHGDFGVAFPGNARARFDGAFSKSAFSYIVPLERTVEVISQVLKGDARVFLYEANSSCVLNPARSRAEPDPERVAATFACEGFKRDFLLGGCSLPAIFWRVPALNAPLLHPLDNLLRKSLYLSFNYILGVSRGGPWTG